MADDNTQQTPTDTPASSEKRPRRRLRPAAETVRERTEKLQQQGQKPASGRTMAVKSFWGGFSWPIRKIGQGLGWFGRFRIVRVIAGAIGRVVLPRYLRNSWRELRLVTWPNRSQSWKLTYAVIVFSVLFGAIVAAVDFGLDKLFKEFIVK